MVDSVVEKGLRHLCEDTTETVGSVCGWVWEGGGVWGVGVHVWEWGEESDIKSMTDSPQLQYSYNTHC